MLGNDVIFCVPQEVLGGPQLRQQSLTLKLHKAATLVVALLSPLAPQHERAHQLSKARVAANP